MVKKKRIGTRECLFILLICLSFFLLLEAIVRIVMPPEANADYALCRGFSPQYRHWLPVATDDAGAVRYRTAPSFLKAIPSRAYDQTFVDPKPQGTFRVFVFGGSSAAGAIFSDRGNISDQLRLRLSDILPERRIEVINAAVEGYGTQRVLKMLGEASRHQPDLFVVYSGHNDLGERAFHRKIFGNDARYERHRFFDYSRAFSLLRAGILRMKTSLVRNETSQGPKKDFQRERKEALAQIQQFGGDFTVEYQRTLKRFQANYEAMIRIAAANEVPLMVMTVVPNLWEWEPESVERSAADSTNGQGDSLKKELCQVLGQEQWDKAALLADRILSLDNTDARIYFIKACLDARHQRWDEVRRNLRTAAKWDASIVMPRTTDDFNGILRDLARTHDDVLFLDMETIVEDAAPHGLIGTRWIFDSCHPQLETYELIANYVVKALALHRIPTENNAARLTTLRSREEYRAVLHLDPVTLAEKERFMAMQTLKLVYPRNTLVAWRCLEHVLLTEPHHPAIRSVMATLLALVENNIVTWTVSASFPGNGRPFEDRVSMATTPANTTNTQASQPNSRDYIVGMGIAEPAAKRMLAWCRETMPCEPQIYETMIGSWREVSEKPEFLHYWARLFHQTLNAELSLQSPIAAAFLGDGWTGFNGWPIGPFPRPLQPTGHRGEFSIPLERETTGRVVLELLPDTGTTASNPFTEAIGHLQLTITASSATAIGNPTIGATAISATAASVRPLTFSRSENQVDTPITLISQTFTCPMGITTMVITQPSPGISLPPLKKIIFLPQR